MEASGEEDEEAEKGGKGGGRGASWELEVCVCLCARAQVAATYLLPESFASIVQPEPSADDLAREARRGQSASGARQQCGPARVRL